MTRWMPGAASPVAWPRADMTARRPSFPARLDLGSPAQAAAPKPALVAGAVSRPSSAPSAVSSSAARSSAATALSTTLTTMSETMLPTMEPVLMLDMVSVSECTKQE